MRDLRQRFPNELVVIGVHSAKFPSEQLTTNIREAILRHDIHHPVVNDAGFQIWRQYGVNAWPTVVLVDPAGNYVGSQAGEIDADQFAPLIEAMIADFDREGVIDRQPLDLEAETEPARPLHYPAKLLVTADGFLFVADTGHHRIIELRLDEDGTAAEVGRVFGSGQPGLEDGPAATARFHSPHGLALRESTLYVADTDNHAVRAVDLDSGTVRTIAGTGEKAAGRFQLGRPTETPLRSPWALAAADDVLFIAMAGSHQIWVLLNEEQLGPFAGNGREALVDGPQSEASFNQPSDLALGMGHLFVADAEASAIRAISLDEEPRVVTLVGQGLFEFGDVDGIGAEVRLQHAAGIAFDHGFVYIADTYNHKIKVLEPTNGRVETLIGTGRVGAADGPFEVAELSGPEGIAILGPRDRHRASALLYIADTNNHLIRLGNLESRRVQTLGLRNLERLLPQPAEAPTGRRLAPVTVAPGQVTLTFDVDLPPGYKLNEEAPLLLRPEQDGDVYRFAADEAPTLRLDVESDRDLDLNLTLYYCQTADERLCMIHNEHLVLPIEVAEDGPSSVGIPYTVPIASP